VHIAAQAAEGAIARRRPDLYKTGATFRRCGGFCFGDQETKRAMTTFNEREKGFEQKYKHDQDLQFKVNARRNRLFGMWAAERMGLSGADADAYAKQVVQSDFEKPGDSDVLAKVAADLAGKGIAATDLELRKEMDRLLSVAKEQIMKQV
jgi:hypothetical protein